MPKAIKWVVLQILGGKKKYNSKNAPGHRTQVINVYVKPIFLIDSFRQWFKSQVIKTSV